MKPLQVQCTSNSHNLQFFPSWFSELTKEDLEAVEPPLPCDTAEASAMTEGPEIVEFQDTCTWRLKSQIL